jgi:hypothetical protein
VKVKVKSNSPATKCQLCQVKIKSRTNKLTPPLIANVKVVVLNTK